MANAEHGSEEPEHASANVELELMLSSSQESMLDVELMPI